MKINKAAILRGTTLFIFWTWHLIYTILALFLFTPLLVGPLLNGALTDTTPWHYLLYSLVIVILPFTSMYLGVKYFHSNHRLLMQYFYGFEMPLLFFLLVRVFTFRDDGWAVNWLMLMVMLALLVWLVFLFIQQRHNTRATNKATNKTTNKTTSKAISVIPLRDDWRGIVGSTLLAGVGIYFGSIFLIIQLPNAVEFIDEVGSALSGITLSDIGELLWLLINPLWWLLGLFLLFTFSLFLVLPLAMIYLYIRQFIQRLPSLMTVPRIAIVLAVIALNIGILYFSTQQPQQTAFDLLEGYEQETQQSRQAIQQETPQETSQATLLTQQDSIREGLLNAYLARYRYLSTTDLSQRIQRNYEKTLGLSAEVAAVPQAIFNALLKPFLYDGKDWGDKARAEQYYAEFFDAPIQKAERDLIVNTLKYTWEAGSDNEAGLLDATNHHVHLDQQSITIEEEQAVATITVQQTLRNLTERPKETVLHFALPEDSALTGVWLSDEEDQPLKYPFALSPKGAAQAVYKAEVNRRIDPALLEQTGPYQYRLRVYPVPAKSFHPDKPTKPLYARFRYQTLADKRGHWPMPQVLEKRNLFWDENTKYWVNGKKLSSGKVRDSFPLNIAQSTASTRTPQAQARTQEKQKSALHFQFNDEQLLAIPRHKDQESLPKTGSFAVLVDGSYSMQKHYPAVQKSLTALRQNSIRFDNYFCKKECRYFEFSNTESTPVFFGNSQPQQHIRAFNRMKRNANYDAILVLSDAGSYELEVKDEQQALPSEQPLWLVHLGDTLAYAYDDELLDTLYRSRGGVTSSALEALRRYQLFADSTSPETSNIPEDAQLVSLSNQYLWFNKNNSTATESTTQEQTEGQTNTPIAAAHWLRHLMRTSDTRKIETLDQIHRIAKQENIVTHYSSMLVLVNDRQKEVLKKAEQQNDRFDREVETGKQQTTAPADPFAVPAVPEPEEWALITIALGLLGHAVWRRRNQFAIYSLWD